MSGLNRRAEEHGARVISYGTRYTSRRNALSLQVIKASCKRKQTDESPLCSGVSLHMPLPQDSFRGGASVRKRFTTIEVTIIPVLSKKIKCTPETRPARDPSIKRASRELPFVIREKPVSRFAL